MSPSTAPFEANEYIVEVRYKLAAPFPQDLDRLTGQVRELMTLARDKIKGKRVDVFDEDNARIAFVSPDHAGFVVHNGETPRFFNEQAARFLGFVFSSQGVGQPARIERIGVRTRFAEAYEGAFDALKVDFQSRLMAPVEGAKSALHKKIAQVIGHEDEAVMGGQINFNGGPIKAKKFIEMFPRFKQGPETALFVETDYWVMPKAAVESARVLSTFQAYTSRNYAVYQWVKKFLEDEKKS